MGALVAAMLPNLFSFFIPFFLIGIVFIRIFGKLVTKLAMGLAGVPREVKEEGLWRRTLYENDLPVASRTTSIG